MMQKELFILYIAFIIPVTVFCQKSISFGKVSMEELKMDRYEKDTTADALILSDIGKLEGNSLHFTRHIRVKVLKKSGLHWGNWTFNTPGKSDFKLAVFNLADGTIVKEKVENSSIYREEIVEGFHVYKVFAPSVRVGSVIDIFYWHIGPPLEWRFQETIPVVNSVLTLEPSDRVKFSKTFFGLEQVETVSTFTWRAQHMPAFRTEPYLNSYSNYITKFSFQLESIMLGAFRFEYSSSWRKIIDNLLLNARFGGVLNSCAFLNSTAKEIKAKNLPVDKTIQEAFTHVQREIKWNGSKSLFATNELKKHYEVDHSGNSAEINLILVTLLKKIGVNAMPMVLSTRDNGLLVDYSPTISKLNYVICYVDHEGTRQFLDATSEFAIPGILPEHCLNGKGLMVKEDNEQWFSLVGQNREVKSLYTELKVENDGETSAVVTRDFSGYAFLNWIEDLKANNYDTAITRNKRQKEYPKIRIDKYEIAVKNKEQLAGKEKLNVDASDHLVDAGDEYWLNPFVLFEYSENPFKSETRKNPVDLAYPKEVRSIVKVKIPDELVIKQVPQNVKFTTPDGGASFTYLASGNQGKLEFLVTVKLSKSIYSETEYLELRQFFSEVIKVINTPVVLSKG